MGLHNLHLGQGYAHIHMCNFKYMKDKCKLKYFYNKSNIDTTFFFD